jgi:hypothetical protein
MPIVSRNNLVYASATFGIWLALLHLEEVDAGDINGR